MTKRQLIITGVVIVAVLATFFYLNGRSLRRAKALTQQLEQQVDSLQLIANDYEGLQKKYENLYAELGTTRELADELRNKVQAITDQQASSISGVKRELTEIINDFDTLEFDVPLDTISIDSLRF